MGPNAHTQHHTMGRRQGPRLELEGRLCMLGAIQAVVGASIRTRPWSNRSNEPRDSFGWVSFLSSFAARSKTVE